MEAYPGLPAPRPQCLHPHPRLCGPLKRKSKVCSSPSSPLQPGEELAFPSEGNVLSALSLTVPATPSSSLDPALGTQMGSLVP